VSNTHSLDDMLAALGWRREWRGDGAAIVVNADDAVVVQPIAGRFYVLTMAGDFDTPADAVTAAYRERFATATPPAAPIPVNALHVVCPTCAAAFDVTPAAGTVILDGPCSCPGCAGDLAGLVDTACPTCREQLGRTFAAFVPTEDFAALRDRLREASGKNAALWDLLNDAAEAIDVLLVPAPPAAPVSGVDVGAIRGRMEAATAGPWRVEKARTVLHVIAALREVVTLSISPPRVPEREIRDEHVRRSWADATFIAHAPTDIATLLSELDRLTARVRELEGEPRRVRVGERVTADNVGALPVGTRIDEEDTDWTATKVGPNEWKSARGFTYTDAAAIDGFHRVIYLPPTPGASDV
jgi:hypothetical protein